MYDMRHKFFIQKCVCVHVSNSHLVQSLGDGKLTNVYFARADFLREFFEVGVDGRDDCVPVFPGEDLVDDEAACVFGEDAPVPADEVEAF
jgi:hypothetical protein